MFSYEYICGNSALLHFSLLHLTQTAPWINIYSYFFVPFIASLLLYLIA